MEPFNRVEMRGRVGSHTISLRAVSPEAVTPLKKDTRHDRR